MFSLFVDVSFNGEKSIYTIGFVIVNEEGQPWRAGFLRIQPPGTVLNAELKAIEEGVRFWKRFYPGRVRILSDFLEAVHDLLTYQEYRGFEEDTLAVIKDLIKDVSVVDVCYCQRKQNIIAHNLAKAASRSPYPRAWVGDDIPRYLMPLA